MALELRMAPHKLTRPGFCRSLPLFMSESESESSPTLASSGFAARIGEFILRTFDSIARPVSSLTSLSDAVAEGFAAVIWRMILTVMLVSIFSTIAGLYEAGAQTIDTFLGWTGGIRGHSGQYACGLVLWIAATGGTALLILKDVDGKWRVLNWFFLAITAGACFTRNASFVAWLVVIMGQAAIHYFIATAADSRRRRAEWMRELERQQEAASKPDRPNLASLYGGVKGFDEDTGRGRRST